MTTSAVDFQWSTQSNARSLNSFKYNVNCFRSWVNFDASPEQMKQNALNIDTCLQLTVKSELQIIVPRYQFNRKNTCWNAK